MAQKGGMSHSAFSIDGVSWMEQLFEMMACRDPEGKLLSVVVPDTVVFRYQRPAAMYYTEDGQVRSTDDMSELSADALMNRFSRKSSLGPEVLCAMYVYRDRNQGTEDKGTKDFTIEYMNTSQLHAFLNTRVKDQNGILQRFTPSRGSNNTTIRVMWTPRKCIVESCSNKFRMDDPRIPVSDKAPTFDNSPHLTMLHDVSKGLFSTKVRAAVMDVIHHVESLLPKGYHVWETTMYWKFAAGVLGTTDEGAGLVFLWCSSVRLFRDEIIDFRHLDDFWTSDVDADRVTSKPAPMRKKDVACCPVSGDPLPRGASVLVKASTLHTYFRALSRKKPLLPEAVRYMQEAVALEEAAKDDGVLGSMSKSTHQGHHSHYQHEDMAQDQIQREVEDEINIIFAAAAKRPKAVVDRTVVELLKRCVFAQTSGITGQHLRMLTSHASLMAHEVDVCEDVALICSQVAMEEADKETRVGVGGGSKRVSKDSESVAGGFRSSHSLARPARLRKGGGFSNLSVCRVVEVKNITVKEPEDGFVSPIEKGRAKNATKSSRVTLHASANAGGFMSGRESTVLDSASATSRIMLLRRMHFAASAPPAEVPDVGGQDALRSTQGGRKKLRAESARDLPAWRGRGGGSRTENGEVLQGRCGKVGQNAQTSNNKLLPQSARGLAGRGVEGKSSADMLGGSNGLGAAGVYGADMFHDYEGHNESKTQGTWGKAHGRSGGWVEGGLGMRSTKQEVHEGRMDWNEGLKDAARKEELSGGGGQRGGKENRNTVSAGDGRKGGVGNRQAGIAVRVGSAHVTERIPARAPQRPSTAMVSRGSCSVGRGSEGLERGRSAELRRQGDEIALEDMHELGIVEDDDQDDWDDGLEMDLPSTSRKFASSSSSGPRGKGSSVQASYRTTRPLGHESPPNDWAFSGAGRSGQRKKEYLFLQWGQKERVREKVLRQYKAFAADVQHIGLDRDED